MGFEDGKREDDAGEADAGVEEPLVFVGDAGCVCVCVEKRRKRGCRWVSIGGGRKQYGRVSSLATRNQHLPPLFDDWSSHLHLSSLVFFPSANVPRK